MFSRKGIIIIDSEGLDEEEVMMTALEAGADDMVVNEDHFEVQTEPSAYHDVHQAITEAGYEIISSEIEYVPSMESTPKAEDIKKLKKMIDLLEENDDVQNVYTNCAIDLDEYDE